MQVAMTLGFDIQRLQKWKQGRAKYGPEFVGDPRNEFYQEMLDASNYLEEMARQGLLLAEDINVLDDMVRATVLRLAEAIHRKGESDARRD